MTRSGVVSARRSGVVALVVIVVLGALTGAVVLLEDRGTKAGSDQTREEVTVAEGPRGWTAGPARSVWPGFAEFHVVLEGTDDLCGEQCGKILSVGAGVPDGRPIVQLYDPKDGPLGSWSSVSGAPGTVFEGTAPVLLKGSDDECGHNCGKVLMHFTNHGPAGNRDLPASQHTESWSLFDPKDGSWTSAGSPNHPRQHGTSATLITRTPGTPNRCGSKCGDVLVVGGGETQNQDIQDVWSLPSFHTAELYDPKANRWTVTGMVNPSGESALVNMDRAAGLVSLHDGRVLAAGHCALYEPGAGPTGAWRFVAHSPTSTACIDGELTVLNDGRVLGDRGSLFDPTGEHLLDDERCRDCPTGSSERGGGGGGETSCNRAGVEPRDYDFSVDFPDSREVLGNGAVLGIYSYYSGVSCAATWTFVFDPSKATPERWRRVSDRPAGDLGLALTRVRGTAKQCGQNCGKVLSSGGAGWSLYTP